MNLQKFAVDKTTKIIYKCCERFAKENNLQLRDVQLNLKVEVEESDGQPVGKVVYIICDKGQPKKKMNFLEVLNAPDFLGQQGIAEPTIFNGIVRYSIELESNPLHVMAVCVAVLGKDDKGKPKEKIRVFIYKDNVLNKEVSVAEFINLDALMQEQEAQQEQQQE